MSYDTFFNHSFLDLEHVPSEISYEKAMKILLDAEKLDKSDQKVEAFNKYCEGLRYLHPIYRGIFSLFSKIVALIKKIKSEIFLG